jgi:ABC-type oligopeptide transport system substrate-binding subunit
MKTLVSSFALVLAISAVATSAEAKTDHHTAHQKQQQQRQVTGNPPPAQPKEPSGGYDRAEKGGRY